MSKITMRQLAEKAGVSAMTVSRALKDNPRISAETRRRIKKLADQLGYKPHPYISALMSGLTRTQNQSAAVNLAVLHFDQIERTHLHHYYHGIRRRTSEIGYTPELFRFDPARLSPERLRRILLSRGIRGIIIMPAPEGETSLDFDFRGFASATLGHTIVSPPLPRVASDIYQGNFQAFDELVARGYRRIGMVITDYVNRLGRFHYSASVLAYGKYVNPGLHLVEYTMDEPSQSPASLAKVKQWINAEKLDAVICPVFEFPLYDILVRQGFDIPGKLGYLHLLPYPNPRVTTLQQQGELMGAKAVDLVVAAINRNEFDPPVTPHTLTIPTAWKEGKTMPRRLVPPAR